ncbi:hypothetical protein BH18VER1_BH18VER1_07980 [soil metagenome]
MFFFFFAWLKVFLLEGLFFLLPILLLAVSLGRPIGTAISLGRHIAVGVGWRTRLAVCVGWCTGPAVSVSWRTRPAVGLGWRVTTRTAQSAISLNALRPTGPLPCLCRSARLSVCFVGPNRARNTLLVPCCHFLAQPVFTLSSLIPSQPFWILVFGTLAFTCLGAASLLALLTVRGALMMSWYPSTFVNVPLFKAYPTSENPT